MQGGLADDLAHLQQPHFEHRMFLRTQIQPTTAEREGAPAAVVSEWSQADDRGAHAVRAPDQSVQTILELAHVERLGEIAIGTEIEALTRSSRSLRAVSTITGVPTPDSRRRCSTTRPSIDGNDRSGMVAS